MQRYGFHFLKRLAATCLLLLMYTATAAQVCPPNIDFENGDFAHWMPYAGFVSAAGGTNTINISPTGVALDNVHQIFSRAQHAQLRDAYGGFPVVCPNGSGYSVKLGNTSGGAQAEGLAYEFVIPANRNIYSLTYHYAVVFQDPNHQIFEQPRLEIEVMNITDNQRIDCSSFTFIPYGSPLPGFFISPVSDGTPVWCKDWTAVTINLNGQAGKRIRLFFKTADCTFRRHFGYAYIDVNSECTGEFTGATFCPNDTEVKVVAPYGFQFYRWMNSDFSRVLGNEQTLLLRPAPAAGTVLAVELTPYNGYGCKDTLFARLQDTLTVRANAGTDQVYCGPQPILLGENPKPGIVYSWSPAEGLSDVNIANPFAAPEKTTLYTLKASSPGGGCVHTDSVVVKVTPLDTLLSVFGKTAYCTSQNDSVVLQVSTEHLVQWYRDGVAMPGARQSRLRPNRSGTYYAAITNSEGCTKNTRSINISIEDPTRGITYPDAYVMVNTELRLKARNLSNELIWQPPVFLDNPTVQQPVFKSNVVRDQQYLIRYTTPAGCQTIDTQWVKVISEVKVFVPTAFTPNNDGLNDFFFPTVIGAKYISMFKVYNRWGQEVFSMDSANSAWDGNYKNLQQPPGTYIWQLQLIGVDDVLYTRKGTVMLIR